MASGKPKESYGADAGLIHVGELGGAVLGFAGGTPAFPGDFMSLSAMIRHHPVDGNRIGPAEGELWRCCRLIHVGELGGAVPGFVRAGRPRSRGASSEPQRDAAGATRRRREPHRPGRRRAMAPLPVERGGDAEAAGGFVRAARAAGGAFIPWDRRTKGIKLHALWWRWL